jgi:hypothetical protein
MSGDAHPFLYSGARHNNMLKKHRALLIALFVLFASMFACCIYLGNDITSRQAAVQVNGYRIDFKYGYDPEFVETFLRITRSDGKSAEVMRRIKTSECPYLTIQSVGSRLYFLCSNEIVSGTAFYAVPYLDIETMLLYSGNNDTTPTPIDSLEFR